MPAPETAAFRRLCVQYRWLAIFMVVSVGVLLAFMHIAFPLALWVRDGQVRERLRPEFLGLRWLLERAACERGAKRSNECAPDHDRGLNAA